MKKLLLSALTGLSLFAAQAGAATYYIKPAQLNAKDTNVGSASLPWKTFGAAGALPRTTPLPGDVIYCYPGNYNFWPAPDSAGSNPTGNGYITYIGVTTAGDALSDSVYRSAITINAEGPASGSYRSYKGFKINNTVHFGGTRRDSLLDCTIVKDLEIAGGDYNYVGRCTIGNNSSHSKVAIGRSGSDKVSDGGVLDSNHFYLGYGAPVNNGEHLWMQGSGSGPNYVDSLIVRFNRVDFNAQASMTVDRSGPTLLHTSRQKFRGNRWSYHLDCAGDYVFRLRDSTRNCTFDVDSVYAAGSGSGIMELSSSGSLAASPNVFGNSWDSCFVNVSGASVEPRFLDGMIDCSITNTVIASRTYALWADMLRGANVVSRSTLIGSPVNGVVDFSQRPDAAAMQDTNLTFTRNIVAGWGTYAAVDPTIDANASHLHSALRLGGVKWDSAGANHTQAGVVMDHNVYPYFGYATAAGDRSILLYDTDHWINSAPAGVVLSSFGIDTLSVYGSARFDNAGPDSTIGPGFAYSSGWGGVVNCMAGAPQVADCDEFPVIRSYQLDGAVFTYGLAATFGVQICNVGSLNASLDPNDAYLPPGVTITSEPDIAGEGTCGLFVFTYDGAGAAGTGYYYIESNDRSLRGPGPAGTSGVGWLRVPVTINP